jgi:hypothetical protein
MKGYKCLACPKYVAIYAPLAFIFVLLESWVLLSMDEPNKLILIISILPPTIAWLSLPYWFNRSAFSVTCISKEGIRNRHLSFRWDEITSYHLCEIDQRTRLGKWGKIKYPMIVCLGDVRSEYLGFCDPRKTVCFPLSKKTLKVIDELCDEKNETIAELLTWIHFPMNS